MAYYMAVTSTSASDYITLINPDTGAAFPYAITSLAQVREAAFSPDGTKVAYVGNGSPYLVVMDLSTGNNITITGGGPGSSSNGVMWSPDGTMLAVAHDNSPYLTVYNTSTWAKLTITGGAPPNSASRVAFSPNNALLAVAHTGSPLLTVYSTSTWAKVTLTGGTPAGNLGRVTFNPAGTQLAHLGSSSPYLTVYDTSTWNKITISGGAPIAVSTLNPALTYSPNGTQLYCGGSSSPYITVYNTSTWAKITSNIPSGLPTIPSAITYDRRNQYAVYGFENATSPAVRCFLLDGTAFTPVWAGAMQTRFQSGSRLITNVAFGGPMRYLRGTVRDTTGTPVARTVRAFVRSTGQYCGYTTSDGTTGDYELRIFDGDVDYDIQFMISPGETLNDLFYARTTTSAT